jgi:tetratricopeptide (TPR) repeat protein
MAASAERDPEADLLAALLAGHFEAARAQLQGVSRGSPYRRSPEVEAPAILRALHLLEHGDPLGAYFTLADASGDEDPYAPAVYAAIGVACEARSERCVARAAHESGTLVESAVRLESEIALTPSGMEEEVDRAGVRHYLARLESDPFEVASIEGLAQRLDRLGDAAAAQEVARRGIALAPQRAACHLVLVDSLSSEDRDEEAQEAAADACASCPAEASIWTLRGELREQAGEPAAALADYERALSVSPEHWPAHLAIERLHRASGDGVALAAQLARMQPFADDAGESDRIDDALEELEHVVGPIAGRDLRDKAERSEAKRLAERDAWLDRLVRGPELHPDGSPRKRMSWPIILVLLFCLVMFLIFKNHR